MESVPASHCPTPGINPITARRARQIVGPPPQAKPSARETYPLPAMPSRPSAVQVAFAAGLRRPSGTCLPPSDVTCPSGALGKRPGVEPHPFVVRLSEELDRANRAPHPSAEQQLRETLQHAEAELASGAAAAAEARLEAALAHLNDTPGVPTRLVGQLQLALGYSCAAQAKHDEARLWYKRCARLLSTPCQDASGSTTAFVPTFNHALQLAALGRYREACSGLQRASLLLAEISLGMHGAPLLAVRLQLLLAQAACAHGASLQARHSERSLCSSGGAGGGAEAAAAAAPSAGQACARALELLDKSAAGGAVLAGLGRPALTQLGEQLQASLLPPTPRDRHLPPAHHTAATYTRPQACAELQPPKRGAACHRHALLLLRRARELLRRDAPRAPAGSEAAVARELAHLSGRLAVSSFALGQRQQGIAWLREAAALLQRAGNRGLAKTARAEQARQLEQEADPVALARLCSALVPA